MVKLDITTDPLPACGQSRGGWSASCARHYVASERLESGAAPSDLAGDWLAVWLTENGVFAPPTTLLSMEV